jgi:hypothetical protein
MRINADPWVLPANESIGDREMAGDEVLYLLHYGWDSPQKRLKEKVI